MRRIKVDVGVIDALTIAGTVTITDNSVESNLVYNENVIFFAVGTDVEYPVRVFSVDKGRIVVVRTDAFTGENGPKKECTRCGESKPLSGFSPVKYTKDGLATVCKDCQYAARSAGQRGKIRYCGTADEVRENPLAAIPGRELFAEIKRRGYKWERMYLVRTDEVIYDKI